MRRKVRAAVKRFKAAAARTYVWRVAGSVRRRVVEIVRRKK
jgi:hypothetical protein